MYLICLGAAASFVHSSVHLYFTLGKITLCGRVANLKNSALPVMKSFKFGNIGKMQNVVQENVQMNILQRNVENKLVIGAVVD